MEGLRFVAAVLHVAVRPAHGAEALAPLLAEDGVGHLGDEGLGEEGEEVQVGEAEGVELLLALLAGLALAAYILALADGPSLVDIIDKY